MRDTLKTKLKHICLSSLLVICSFMALEAVSYILMRTILQPHSHAGLEGDRLTKNFPAQIRMSAEEIIKEFPNALPLKRTGNFMVFDFEPVLGFTLPDSLRWYGGSPDDLEDKFIILTFGGSTTVMDNWPKYLKKYAEEEKIQQDLIVLNAGFWGYMTFNERIYFTAKILPMLEEKGIKPDLVLSLDGVNDTWTRIVSYLESKKQNSPEWFSYYHGYHQQLDTDMRQLGNISTSVQQMLSNIARKSYSLVINHISRFIPYTLKMCIEVTRKVLQHKPSEKSNLRTAVNTVQLEENITNSIISAIKSNLLDFYGAAEARGIFFVAYLQPVLLKQYYPHSIPKSFFYPSFDYVGINLYRENRMFSRLYGKYIVETQSLYLDIEKTYNQLNDYLPGHFKSLASIFYDNPQAEKLYNKDAMHYEQMGKEIIARKVILDLLEKKILTR